MTGIQTNVRYYCIERHFKQLFTVIITAELTNSPWHLYQKCFSFRCTLVILHLSRMHRNVNLKVYIDWKNVSATAAYYTTAICGCVTRLASWVIPCFVESNAVSSNSDSTVIWEHCRIPLFIIISFYFITSISSIAVSQGSTRSYIVKKHGIQKLVYVGMLLFWNKKADLICE